MSTNSLSNQSPDERRPMKVLRRALLAAVAALALSVPMVSVNAPAAQAKDCNMSNWTWPVCEISRPTVPSFHVEGPRPNLTPKSSAWCRNTYISASGSGYVYWALTQNTKIDISFWPDYSSRYYQAMYWDGRKWAWVPASASYPNVILGQRVNCDA
jgi:hypothetical protein